METSMAHNTVTLSNGKVIEIKILKADRDLASLLPGGKYYSSPTYLYEGLKGPWGLSTGIQDWAERKAETYGPDLYNIAGMVKGRSSNNNNILIWSKVASDDTISFFYDETFGGNQGDKRVSQFFGDNYRIYAGGGGNSSFLEISRIDDENNAETILYSQNYGPNIPSNFLINDFRHYLTMNDNNIGISVKAQLDKNYYSHALRVDIVGDVATPVNGSSQYLYSANNYINPSAQMWRTAIPTIDHADNSFYVSAIRWNSSAGTYQHMLSKIIVNPTTLAQTAYSTEITGALAYGSNLTEEMQLVALQDDQVLMTGRGCNKIWKFKFNSSTNQFDLLGSDSINSARSIAEYDNGNKALLINYTSGTGKYNLVHYSDIINSFNKTTEEIDQSSLVGYSPVEMFISIASDTHAVIYASMQGAAKKLAAQAIKLTS